MLTWVKAYAGLLTDEQGVSAGHHEESKAGMIKLQ